ncbi:hypothetical protein RR46_07126 [Papilio xuthus]|uniref:Secreted protein n=1 Tax=Papilio xuthus TaxID=66420 RepID=A0A194QAT5_PAPXU|nr:hypothetical protein RR46_07126 [Papilio xuthus]
MWNHFHFTPIFSVVVASVEQAICGTSNAAVEPIQMIYIKRDEVRHETRPIEQLSKQTPSQKILGTTKVTAVSSSIATYVFEWLE